MKFRLLSVISICAALAGCAYRSNFLVRVTDSGYIKEKEIGLFDWRYSPPAFVARSHGTLADSGIDSRIPEIVEGLSKTQEYIEERSRIQSIVFDRTAGFIWLRMQNCRYFVYAVSLTARESNNIGDATALGGYEIIERGVMARCRNL